MLHFTKRQLDLNSHELLAIHLQLTEVLLEVDWEWIDVATTAQQVSSQKKTTEVQKGKFTQLSQQQCSAERKSTERTVINMTEKEIDAGAISALKKGLNFAPAPRSIPICDIISGVKQAICKIPSESVDKIHGKICCIISKSKPLRSNLTRAERNGFHTLRNDSLVVVLLSAPFTRHVLVVNWEIKCNCLNLCIKQLEDRLAIDSVFWEELDGLMGHPELLAIC
ncbi:uncharacterized protein LOC124613511 [Schistocerca americana]|uniref:uncharacterized protein LOC124613511 n=1 Tax=Schistocerca americana TaxID=7009 RepID=UPI001F4F3226|nr:uncharacterized protein LOC124613511 [Schistocerca americana]